MLILQNISYLHTNRDLLFDKITFTANQQEKIALIGNNGGAIALYEKLGFITRRKMSFWNITK